MNRFFLPANTIQKAKVQFPADRSHQIVRVLRLQTGDHVCVLDNTGKSYLVELVELDVKSCLGEIIEVLTNDTEPKTNVHLIVALTQREKFEFILQKCTEIGVNRFTPVFTERSLLQGMSEVEKKAERWGRIVMEASEQCQRPRIPHIDEAIPFNQSLLTDADQKLIAFENNHKFNIHSALSGSKDEKIAVLIGPEGGFSQQEVELAIAYGWKSVSLGPRILRMETAAMVAATLILDHFGELD
ncbi:MAG: 16S rRNA (uracil(1498)-N(3))-methyltransferase [Anaerolineaceae bacterium]